MMSGSISNNPTGGEPTGELEIFYRRGYWLFILLAAAWAFGSLWDFRFHRLRPFDIFALAAIVGFILLTWSEDKDWPSRGRPVFPLFVIFIAYCVFGYVDFRHRSSVAMILLSLVGLYFIVINRTSKVFVICKWLCAIYIAAFLI